MAEEEVDGECAQRDGRAGECPDPENGWDGADNPLQVTAEVSLDRDLMVVLECILVDVQEKHISGAMRMMDLSSQILSGQGVREEAYQSFAEELWKAYREQGGNSL